MKQTFILDGDLQRRTILTVRCLNGFQKQITRVHTALPGRNVGINDELITTMARESIHLHI